MEKAIIFERILLGFQWITHLVLKEVCPISGEPRQFGGVVIVWYIRQFWMQRFLYSWRGKGQVSFSITC
jgi:hypothetical protein